MRILYVDMNVINHNPTRNNYINLLKHIGKVDIFGIGFSNEDDLQKGFMNRIKEYDLLIFNNVYITGKRQFFEKNGEIKREGIFNFFKYYKKYFNLSCIEKYFLKIVEEIKEVKLPKIMLWLEIDYFYFKRENVYELKNIDNLYFVSFGEDFLGKKHKDALKEKHIRLATGNEWELFVKENRDKFITFSHFVNESEFFYGDLSNRKYNIVVPGVEYYRRKKAIEVLKENGYNMPSKAYMKVFSLLNKLGVPVYNSFIGNKLYNLMYYDMLINSKFVYTASGGYNGPVRKFFEIPASGACMIMDLFNGYDKLGFIENENFIYATYDNLLEVLDNISLREAQRIADNGRELIWAKHTTFSRAKMLKNIFENILNKTFKGTYWEKGEIKVVN